MNEWRNICWMKSIFWLLSLTDLYMISRYRCHLTLSSPLGRYTLSMGGVRFKSAVTAYSGICLLKCSCYPKSFHPISKRRFENIKTIWGFKYLEALYLFTFAGF